jgi:hypothetical protein
MRSLLLILMAVLPAHAETLATKDGKSLAYETIEIDPKTPKTALLLRSGTSVTTLKLSEVDPAALPDTQRQLLLDFTKQQNGDGLILLDDEWINRDEHLLKLDKRFAYEKKLHRGTGNVIKVINPQKQRVTLGVRGVGEIPGDGKGIDGKGLEFSVEPLKSKQLTGFPDGTYFFYFVFASEDDSKLHVEKTEPIKLKNVIYELTMAAAADGLKTQNMGTIDIPPEMRFAK